MEEGQSTRVSINIGSIEDFNQHVEMEKKNRENLVKEVEEFSGRWQKLLDEDEEKRMSALYEQLHARLEAINSDLGSLQVSEEELHKFHAVITVFDVHSKDSKEGLI